MGRSEDFIEKFSTRLKGRSEQDIGTFALQVRWFLKECAYACQLPGEMLLVLDNSVVQAFKHRGTQPKRELAALAYIAFCRFVAGWSNRQGGLALSPFAVYEHCGRLPVAGIQQAETTLADLRNLLADAELPVHGLDFADGKSLFEKFSDIEWDEKFLSDCFREVDSHDWVLPDHLFGRPLPFVAAHDAASEKLPLRYFDCYYIRRALAARIEQHIIKQWPSDGHQPLPSPEAARVLRKLIRQGRLAEGLR